MKRWLVLIALLPQCTGCLAYAYPTLSHTPALAVPNPDGSVHAYRVDIDKTERAPLAPLTQYTLAKIPVDSRGLIPSQLEVAAATGVLNPIGFVDGGQHERSQYSMLVRVYRPGFHTIEVKAWEKSRELHWTPAPELVMQEKAIDDLLAVPHREASPPPPIVGGVAPREMPVKGNWWELKDEKSPGLGLQPGSISSGQREAIFFAANEYQRLAGTPLAASLNMQTLRERMQQKANWLRRYADQAPTP